MLVYFSLELGLPKWCNQLVNIYWMPDMWNKPYEMQNIFSSLPFTIIVQILFS